MDCLYSQGLEGRLRTSNYLVPVLTELERLFKEDHSPNFHIIRLHCGEQYYQTDWTQGEYISELPHVYSVSLWDENKYHWGENMCFF